MTEDNRTRDELLAEIADLKRHIADLNESRHDQVKPGTINVHNILSNLIDHMPSLVYVKDRESRFVICSEEVARLMGAAKAEDLIGKTDHDFYPREKADEFRADEKRVMESETPMVGKDEPIELGDGRTHWILTTKIPLRGPTGAIAGLIGIGHDITDRKKVERERDEVIKTLREALAKISTLRGLLPICSWCKKVRDDDGYWHQVEVYVRDHSDANFTHGVCPECQKKLCAESE